MEKTYLRFKEVYKAAMLSEVRQGTGWYREAHIYLEQLAAHFDLPIEKVIGITAALSPRANWKQNISDTYHFIKNKGKYKVVSYYQQKQKALAILRLKKVTEDKILNILHGPKTSQFFLTILHPEIDHNPVIDRHIIRCYLNKATCSDRELGKIFGSLKTLETISNAITQIAKEENIFVSHCQAIIWSVWKRLTKNHVKSNAFPIFESLINGVTEQQTLNL
jgi:hypothetical protein